MVPNADHTRICQANRVEHAPGKLRNPRSGVARPGLQRDCFGDQTSEPIELQDAVELLAKARRTCCEEDRILESLAEELAGEVLGHYGSTTLTVGAGCTRRRAGCSSSSRRGASSLPGLTRVPRAGMRAAANDA